MRLRRLTKISYFFSLRFGAEQLTAAAVMAGMEVEYDVTTATSEDPDFPAENLAEGRRKGWRAARGAPRAALELKLASPCHLKSVRVGNQDSPVAVVVFAQGSAVERGSFVGSAPLQAGAEQRGNCVRLAANHLSAGMVFEFKVGSRDDMLKAIASQHEWVSLRLEVTPLVAAGGTPPESFGLKKLEVERTLTDGEKKQREAAVTAASQPRPTPQPSQPLQPLEQSQPPSNASRPAQPLQPPAAAAAKPAAAPAPVRPAPPSARMSLQCLAHPEGCNGCGPKCGKEGKGCPLFGRQQSVRLPRSSPPPHEAVRPLALSPTRPLAHSHRDNILLTPGCACDRCCSARGRCHERVRTPSTGGASARGAAS